MEKEYWFAMYVKMHHEKRVAEKLSIMGIKNFLPLQDTVRQWSDRKKKIQKVVIPMMIFIKGSEKKRLEALTTISSITGTLIDKSTHKPAIIRDEEMERFIFMLDNSEERVEFTYENLRPGEKVEVIKGPLSGLQGEFTEFDGKSQVSIRVSTLGCAIVCIPANYLKKIDN